MPLSQDRYRALETEALQAAAQAETEAAEQAAANAPETETKPDGYYLTCTPEERQAELRRLGIHHHGHGLAG